MLKRFFSLASILALSIESKVFTMYCGAFGVGFDCALIQHGQVISYASR